MSKHEAYLIWTKAHGDCKGCHWDAPLAGDKGPKTKPPCTCGPQPCPRCGQTAADNIYSYDACDLCIPQCFVDFHEAYNWLEEHPLFYVLRAMDDDGKHQTLYGFSKSLEMAVCLVDPKDLEPSDDPTKNTQTRIYLAVGPWVDPEKGTYIEKRNMHRYNQEWVRLPPRDDDLASAGATYEEAILMLANKVLDKYGDYRPQPQSEVSCPEASLMKKYA